MIDGLLLAVALTAACTTSTTSVSVTCLVEGWLSSETAEVGHEVSFSGTPLTDAADTWVSVGGVPAEILDVTRENCALCDACKEAESATCHSCGRCEACAESCASCVETVDFVVPSVPNGEQAVVVVNSYGAADGLTLEITAPADDTDSDAPADTSADSDSGDSDSGDTDGRSADSDAP